MHRLHAYSDLQTMFRRLFIASFIGILAALGGLAAGALLWGWQRPRLGPLAAGR